MIWLTWRQFRAQAAVVGCALAILVVTFAVSGAHVRHLYSTRGAEFLKRADNDSTASTLYIVGTLVLLAAPAVIGAFWGAPLVARELDTGTHRLVWNQTITRHRWLAAKLAVVGAAAMAATGILSLALTWWAAPIDQAGDNSITSAAPVGFLFPRLSPVAFSARGIAPVGYAAFAFVLGVTLGVITRRILAALALTSVVCVAAEAAESLWIRPRFIAPEHVVTTITHDNLLNATTVNIHEPGAWITSTDIVNISGHPVGNVSLSDWMKCIPGPGTTDQGCFDRLAALGYRARVSYQPGSRFWAFQWYDTALFLALAIVLTGLCAWWVKRVLS
jgi:hypothetical protein